MLNTTVLHKEILNYPRQNDHTDLKPVVTNIINKNNHNSIIVEHDKTKNEFLFKTTDNQLIGGFNILQLFKLLNIDHDTFLVDINIGQSSNIICKYIYDQKKDINNTCELISHLESPFTSNIELLVKLYTDIIKLENEINEEIITKPVVIALQIKERNNKFIFNILIRILKLSNTLIDQIKNDNPAKDTLIRYSVGAVYKLSTMTNDEIEIKKIQFDIFKTDINKLKQIQETINDKLDKLQESLNLQNINIDNLSKQLLTNIQHGEDKSSISLTNTINSIISTPISTTSNSTNSTNSNTNTVSNTNKFSETSSIVNSGKHNKKSDIIGSSTEKTRSLINSYKLNSSYDASSLNTFTLT